MLARAGVQIGRRLACVAEVSRRGGPGGDSDRRAGQEVAIIAFMPYIHFIRPGQKVASIYAVLCVASLVELLITSYLHVGVRPAARTCTP